MTRNDENNQVVMHAKRDTLSRFNLANGDAVRPDALADMHSLPRTILAYDAERAVRATTVVVRCFSREDMNHHI